MRSVESIRYKNTNEPLTNTRWIYNGEKDEFGHFEIGEKYTVIDVDSWFHAPYERGVYMTWEEYPNTKDVDMCCFVPVSVFYNEFIEA